MNPADDVERTIENLYIATKAETDERILEDAFAALEKSAQGQSPGTGRDVRQNIFRNRIIKFAAVAAVIIVIFTLFLKGPATTTSAPGGIDAALKKAENICITKFQTGGTEPYEQQWLSTTLNVKLLKSVENNRVQFALWDIPKKIKMQTFLSSNSVRTEPITEKMLAEFEESMIQNAGLVSFFNMENIAELVPAQRRAGDGKWHRVIDPQLSAQNPGTKIYEQLWRQENTTTGAVTFRKWRIFADTKTNLPKKGEWYAKVKSDEEYKLESYTVFSYPRQEEIQTLIRTTFGPVGRQPEYIGTPDF